MPSVDYPCATVFALLGAEPVCRNPDTVVSPEEALLFIRRLDVFREKLKK